MQGTVAAIGIGNGADFFVGGQALGQGAGGRSVIVFVFQKEVPAVSKIAGGFGEDAAMWVQPVSCLALAKWRVEEPRCGSRNKGGRRVGVAAATTNHVSERDRDYEHTANSRIAHGSNSLAEPERREPSADKCQRHEQAPRHAQQTVNEKRP